MEECRESLGKTKFQWENLTDDKTGLKIIDACQAGNYYGKEVIVEKNC